jgi:hypothetical protein
MQHYTGRIENPSKRATRAQGQTLPDLLGPVVRGPSATTARCVHRVAHCRHHRVARRNVEQRGDGGVPQQAID